MGTDIHGVFQRYTSPGWEDIHSDYEFNRHYQLFAVLAGVRNGYGFAGIPTGEAVTPIAPPRGLPSQDFVTVGNNHPIPSVDILPEWRKKYRVSGEPLEVWMGDHSFSWLSGEEMLRWYSNAPTVVQSGVISRGEYETWDKTTKPESYSQGITGPGIVVISEPEIGKTDKDWTHVRVTWEQGLRAELSYFFDEVKRLFKEHGRIRFVFGFDS